MIWIKFFISALIIVLAGTHLTRYVDELSDRLNLGKAWIGAVLLGMITSLPEAILSVYSIVRLDALDLAVGNILGSNNINPMILVIMDCVYRKGSITDAVHFGRSHRASMLFAMILSVMVIVEMWHPVAQVGPVSLGSIAIVIFYFWGMWRLSQYKDEAPEGAEHITDLPSMDVKGSLGSLIARLCLAAAVVIVGAIWLADAGDGIAAATGLGRTFVGSIFIAFVTSLPEIVVSLAALRMGSLDLAVGNIFGSNMTNLSFVFICDLASVRGPVLALVGGAHYVTIGLSMVLMTIAFFGFTSRPKKMFAGVGLDSILMLVTFVAGSALLFYLR